MSMIQLSVQHHTTFQEAKASLASAVADVQNSYGRLLKETTWSADGTEVALSGPGVVVDLKIDETHLHAEGDVPMLGKLLGSAMGQQLSQGLRGTLQRHFPRGIPDDRAKENPIRR